MQYLLSFIIKYRTFCLFFTLFTTSLIITFKSQNYHRSLYFNASNNLSGSIYNALYNTKQYFRLSHKNKLLHEENRQLKEKILNYPLPSQSSQIPFENYHLISGNIIKNSYAKPNNFLIINKGSLHGVKKDLGVINQKGVLGVIDVVNKKYAGIISILNRNLNIVAQLKQTNHFGTLSWDGKSHKTVQLKDISVFAPVQIGDSIITSTNSLLFPKGIPIGKITAFQVDANGDSYLIDVELFNDMTNLDNAYIIHNNNSAEIKKIETSLKDDI